MLNPSERRLLLLLFAWLVSGIGLDVALRSQPRVAARLLGSERVADVLEAGSEEPELGRSPGTTATPVAAVAGSRAQARRERAGAARRRRGLAYDAAGRLDLNLADSTELVLLEGVGPALASRILGERRRRGRFAQPADLLGVRGIGRKTLAKLLPQVTVRAAKDSLVRAGP